MKRILLGTALKTRRGTNLYQFWGDRITRLIAGRMEDHEDRTPVNLASAEYFKAVRPGSGIVGSRATTPPGAAGSSVATQAQSSAALGSWGMMLQKGGEGSTPTALRPP